MTLVATTQLFDTPVLIGDVLVSSPPAAPRKRRFPSQPPDKLLDSEATQSNLLPSDTRRKAYIVSDNFAVAFAGRVRPAASLLERVFSRFAGQSVAFEEWEEFITSERSQAQRFIVTGWIVERERRVAFRWDSTHPLRLEKGTRFFEGSGADFARRTFRQPEIYTSPSTESTEKATFCSLDCISALIAFELRYGKNLQSLFDLCYEAIVFAGSRFKYIDDINYLHYFYRWHADRPNSIEGSIVRFRLHYRHFDDYACCIISNHQYDPHVDGFFVVRPVFGEKSQKDWAPSKTLCQSFDARYFCNFVFVDASDGKNMNRGFVVERGSPFLPIEYEDQGGDTYVRMKEDQDFILQYYLNSRGDPS